MTSQNDSQSVRKIQGLANLSAIDNSIAVVCPLKIKQIDANEDVPWLASFLYSWNGLDLHGYNIEHFVVIHSFVVVVKLYKKKKKSSMMYYWINIKYIYKIIKQQYFLTNSVCFGLKLALILFS